MFLPQILLFSFVRISTAVFCLQQLVGKPCPSEEGERRLIFRSSVPVEEVYEEPAVVQSRVLHCRCPACPSRRTPQIVFQDFAEPAEVQPAARVTSPCGLLARRPEVEPEQYVVLPWSRRAKTLKRRSTNNPSDSYTTHRGIDVESEVDGWSGTSEEELCNSPPLRKLVSKFVVGSSSQASTSIAGSLPDGRPFVVVCSNHPFSFIFKHQSQYCSATSLSTRCFVFAL